MNDPIDKILFPQITDFNDLFEAIKTYQTTTNKNLKNINHKPADFYYCGGISDKVSQGPKWDHACVKPKEFVLDAVRDRCCNGSLASFNVIKESWYSTTGKVLIHAWDTYSIASVFVALVDPATIPGYEV